MPEVPNCAVAKLDANDTAMNSAAKIAAGPSSKGLALVAGRTGPCSFASFAAGLVRQYCSAQMAKAAYAKPPRAGASSRASVRLKIATTAAIRKYMMPVASVMPACACRLSAGSAFACRASTTVAAVDE